MIEVYKLLYDYHAPAIKNGDYTTTNINLI